MGSRAAGHSGGRGGILAEMRRLRASVVTLLARERGFAVGGRVVEIERLEFVVPRRRNREVGIDPNALIRERNC